MAGHIEIDEARCKGCQLCTVACPKKLVVMAQHFNALGYRPSRFTNEKMQCTGCMLCALICPEAAITVYRGEARRATAADSATPTSHVRSMAWPGS